MEDTDIHMEERSDLDYGYDCDLGYDCDHDMEFSSSEEEESYSLYERGEKYQYFDIMTKLTTCDRDYLIRNNGDRVKVESLKGKTLLFFMIKRLPLSDYLDFLSKQLLIMYHELKKKEKKDDFDFEFEVVVVVQAKTCCSKARFDEFFSNNNNILPYLAIPFEDSKSRARVYRRLHYWSEIFKIIDPYGRVMPFDTQSILAYGIDAYPFTRERAQEISKEKVSTLRSRSLEKLLATPTCDYVLSIGSDRGVVPISDLIKKNKLVALYLCDKYPDGRLMTQVKKVYQQCRARGLDFEVVVIYVRFNDSLQDYKGFLQDQLGDMPTWLALPFRDKRCFKLCELFKCKDDWLIVVGHEGSFMDEYAGEVICEYGIDAYPFTRDKVIYNETAKLLYSLTLDSLGDYLINKDGVRFPLDSLKGRNVFLYLDRHSRPGGRLYKRLRRWYAKIKARDDAFEVVYVSLTKKESSFRRCLSAMPWLALSYDLNHSQSIAHKTLYKPPHALIAFGSNGRLLTNKADEYLYRQGLDAYPLIHINLMDEVKLHVAFNHGWPWAPGHEIDRMDCP